MSVDSSDYQWKCVGVIKQNALVVLTLFGVCVGFGTGFLLQSRDLSYSGLMWLGENISFTHIHAE